MYFDIPGALQPPLSYQQNALTANANKNTGKENATHSATVSDSGNEHEKASVAYDYDTDDIDRIMDKELEYNSTKQNLYLIAQAF